MKRAKKDTDIVLDGDSTGRLVRLGDLINEEEILTAEISPVLGRLTDIHLQMYNLRQEIRAIEMVQRHISTMTVEEIGYAFGAFHGETT